VVIPPAKGTAPTIRRDHVTSQEERHPGATAGGRAGEEAAKEARGEEDEGAVNVPDRVLLDTRRYFAELNRPEPNSDAEDEAHDRAVQERLDKDIV
jgi:hypothetical protein